MTPPPSALATSRWGRRASLLSEIWILSFGKGRTRFFSFRFREAVCDVSDLKLLQCLTPSLLWFQVEVLRMLILPKHQETQFSNKPETILCKNAVAVFSCTACPWESLRSAPRTLLCSQCLCSGGVMWKHGGQQAGAAVWYQPAAVTRVTKSRAAAIWTWENPAGRWRARARGSWGTPGRHQCGWCAEKEEKHGRKRKENSLSSVE